MFVQGECACDELTMKKKIFQLELDHSNKEEMMEVKKTKESSLVKLPRHLINELLHDHPN